MIGPSCATWHVCSTAQTAHDSPHFAFSPLCSGIDMIKLGYVSRALPRDNRNHVILGTQAVKPRDFAAQVCALGL